MLFRLFFWLARLVKPLVSKVTGWQWQPVPADLTKAVLVIAPHTSNWDFPVMLFYFTDTADRTYWMGKDGLFRGPMNWFMRWLHGIPINRRVSSNVVDLHAREFERRDKMHLGITPEGTRKRKEYWRSGFYYIALQAKVPLLLGYMDYPRKIVGNGPLLMPTGDIEADMTIMREFYSGITGKRPDQASPVRVAPRTERL